MKKINQITLYQTVVKGFLLRYTVCFIAVGFLFLSGCAGLRFSGGQTYPAEVDAATSYSAGVRFFPDTPVGIDLRYQQTNFAEDTKTSTLGGNLLVRVYKSLYVLGGGSYGLEGPFEYGAEAGAGLQFNLFEGPFLSADLFGEGGYERRYFKTESGAPKIDPLEGPFFRVGLVLCMGCN